MEKQNLTTKIVYNSSKYVPVPKPVKTDYLVGTYVFPGWSKYRMQKWTGQGLLPESKWKKVEEWTRMMLLPHPRPYLGTYEDSKPVVADWHIKWAVEHGINLFVFFWYWREGIKSLEHYLEKAFLKSKYLNYIKFCVDWCNEWSPEFGSLSEENLRDMVEYMSKNYFKYPNYFKIDNKPVILFHNISFLTDNPKGIEDSKYIISKMNEVTKKNGYNGLYLIGVIGDYSYAGFEKVYKTKLFDALTSHHYTPNGINYETLIKIHKEKSSLGYETAKSNHSHYIPIISSGFNETARFHTVSNEPEKWRIISNSPPTVENFYKMCEVVKPYIDRKLKMVIVTAWNEWTEGSHIEPHHETGFGYLDAIRTVYSREKNKHTDIIPTEKEIWEFSFFSKKKFNELNNRTKIFISQ